MNTIPHELRERPQWVVWKHIARSGEQTKVPFQPNGQEAKSNDPSTWSAFEACAAVASCYEGFGFVFAADDPYVGIDLDGCRNPETGELLDWGKQAILALASYAEVSPSGTGVKVFCRGKSPYPTGRNIKLKDKPQITDKAPGIEIYDHGRYFAVTGKRLKSMEEIRDCQAEVNAVCNALIPKPSPVTRTSSWQSESEVAERARKYIAQMPAAVSGNGGHNATFRVACVLVLGFGLSKGAAYHLLAEYNDRCDPPWSERELKHKIESADKQSGERNYLRDADQDQWESIELPDYEPPAGRAKPRHQQPQVRITTLKQAALAYVDKIEAGEQSLVELGLGEVDHALGGGVEPGELVVMAARPSHGKSAAALQVLHTWTGNGRKAAMISEEMSALALGKRTVQFVSEVQQEHWFHSADRMRHEIDLHFANRQECWIVEGCKAAEVAAEQIRRAHREHAIQGAVVDYAQLLQSPGKSRYEQVTNTSVCLRQVASELKIVLIVLAQLSRAIESRSVYIPMMSDLKESGQIEQDADVIMFLVWPSRLDPKKPLEEYEFYIAKNRNREIRKSSVTCRFIPSRQMIMPQALRRVVSLQPKKDPFLAQFEHGNEEEF